MVLLANPTALHLWGILLTNMHKSLNFSTSKYVSFFLPKGFLIMPKFSLFLLVSSSLIALSAEAGNIFNSMDKNALKDMIIGRATAPGFAPSPCILRGGTLDWGIFAQVKSIFTLGEGIHPSIKALQELDIPKQTTLEAVENVASYAKATGIIAVGIGNLAKGASNTTTGTAGVQEGINDMEEQRQRAIKLEQSANVAGNQQIIGRPRTLSSERREAVDQLNGMSFEESRYMAHQEELNNSPTRYFREMHFKRINNLVFKETPK